VKLRSGYIPPTACGFAKINYVCCLVSATFLFTKVEDETLMCRVWHIQARDFDFEVFFFFNFKQKACTCLCLVTGTLC
jgi:hypothetical protein